MSDTYEFRKLTKQELINYYKWYTDIMSERLKILSDTVKSSKGYENWNPDYSSESLEVLGDWFYENAAIRKATKEENDEIYAGMSVKFKDAIELDDWDLTDKTFSLAFDIGMYFANVILKNYPQKIKLIHYIKCGKTNAYYGQPVLEGFGKTVLSPSVIAEVIARHFAEKTKTGGGLKKLYAIWTENIE